MIRSALSARSVSCGLGSAGSCFRLFCEQDRPSTEWLLMIQSQEGSMFGDLENE